MINAGRLISRWWGKALQLLTVRERLLLLVILALFLLGLAARDCARRGRRPEPLPAPRPAKADAGK